MRITQESDYALRIITAMAAYDGVADAGRIAEQTSVSPRFTLKILNKLVKGGLVSSYKGAKGGYKLRVSADDITLKTIIELIDGPVAIARCVEGSEEGLVYGRYNWNHSIRCEIGSQYRQQNRHYR